MQIPSRMQHDGKICQFNVSHYDISDITKCIQYVRVCNYQSVMYCWSCDVSTSEDAEIYNHIHLECVNCDVSRVFGRPR